MSRCYGIPFSDVWAAVLSVAAGLRGWDVPERNSTRGLLRLHTLSALGLRPLEANISLWLDDLGQTRLEMDFIEPRRLLLPPAAPARARRFLRRLDRALEIPSQG